MGGCDGGLAHRWPDLTVPQWPTEEAHRCSLASPPPLSASDTSSQPPSLSRASPPRHTRAHMVLGHKVEAAGPGACSPRLAAGGRATPSQGQLLRLALPSRAAPTAGRAWTGRLASGTSRLSPSAQHPALLLASSRQASPCSRQPRAPPRWPSPWRGAKPSACGWRGALPGGPQAFVGAGRGQGAGRGRTLPPPPTPGGAQEGDGGRVDRLSPLGVTDGRPHQPGPRAGLPWALADCTRPGRWVREGAGPWEMVHGLIPALPLCDLRQLSDPLWASSAVPCGRRLAARRGGRGGGVRRRGVVSHRPRGRGGGRVAWGVWGCPWRSCASGPSARPLGVPGRVWLPGRAGGRPCGGGPDAPFSCSPGLRDAQGSQPASF